MCRSCWYSDHGAPVIAGEEVLLTAQLIRRLYIDLGQDTGGPLHWMLDDMNIDDAQFEDRDDIYHTKLYAHLWSDQFAAYAQAGEDTSTERRQAIEDTCRLIWTSLERMPETHRAAAIAYAEGWAQDLLGREPEWPGEQAMAVYCDELRIPVTREKACGEISCPPFGEVTLRVSATSRQDQTGQRQRAIRHAMSDLVIRGDTFLTRHPDGMVSRAPAWQRQAWEYGHTNPMLPHLLVGDLPGGMARRGFELAPGALDEIRRQYESGQP